MRFVDSHCHIHEIAAGQKGDGSVAAVWQQAGLTDAEVLIKRAGEAGVDRLICVGTSLPDSRLAVEFAKSRPEVWASIGIHPHAAKDYVPFPDKLQKFCNLLEERQTGRVVAVGECGLDYYYGHSPPSDQQKLLRLQIDLALEHSLPLIFHVRGEPPGQAAEPDRAFTDFFKLLDEYAAAGQLVRGVVHSFTAGRKTLDGVLERGLFVGLNGIMTFSKNPEQLAAARAVPTERLLLETDAPFLTPNPFRGKVCEPKHLRVTAEFLSGLRQEPLEALAEATTLSAEQLFAL